MPCFYSEAIIDYLYANIDPGQIRFHLNFAAFLRIGNGIGNQLPKMLSSATGSADVVGRGPFRTSRVSDCFFSAARVLRKSDTFFKISSRRTGLGSWQMAPDSIRERSSKSPMREINPLVFSLARERR